MLSSEEMMDDALVILKMLPPAPFGCVQISLMCRDLSNLDPCLSPIRPMLAKTFMSCHWIESVLLPLLECFADYPGDLLNLEAREDGRELLKLILNHAMDLIAASYKQGADPSVHLKDRAGEVIFAPLLKLLQRMKGHGLANKRFGCQLLCMLCTKSKANAQLLRGHIPAGSADDVDKRKFRSLKSAFIDTLSSLLPDCGDYISQNHLLEALYRMIRNTLNDVNDTHLTVLVPQGSWSNAEGAREARRRFEELALNDNTKGIDLDEALREVIYAYNESLGTRAT